MVRRNELACRDGWDRNLWEAGGREPAEPASEVTDLDSPARPGPSLTPAHYSAHRLVTQGEDVLLSEARIVSDGPGTWEPPRIPAMAGFDPRTAIFRAREAYRERARVKAAEVRQATAADPLSTAVPEPGQEAIEFELQSSQPTNSSVSEPSRPKSANVDRDVGEVISTRSNAPSRVPPPSNAAATLQLDSNPIEAFTPEAIVTEPSAVPAASTPTTSDRYRPDASTGPQDRQVQGQDEHREELAAGPVTGATSLPLWFRTDLPRVCRTCRDYRPAADGQRGWCANSWAFTHSRLVQADDGAPCQSAIGDWWVAVDDVWLVAADVSAHGRGTPLLDRLVPEEGEKRRRS